MNEPKRHYNSPGMRYLARCVEELDARLRVLEGSVVLQNVAPENEILAHRSVVWPNPTTADDLGPAGIPLNSPTADDLAVAEILEELRPDAYEIRPGRHGWYQVIDTATDKPVHDGYLRRDAARAKVEELLAKPAKTV